MKKRNKFLKRGDWIIAAGLVFLGVLTWAGIRFLGKRDSATRVIISSADTNYSIPLTDTVVNIAGPLGSTVLRIDDNKVWVEQPPCPQKTCARQGKISRIGESIVCLPNKIVITIEGDSDVDAISY